MQSLEFNKNSSGEAALFMVCTAVQISGSNLSDIPGSGQTSKETRLYFKFSEPIVSNLPCLSSSHSDGMHLVVGTVSKDLDTATKIPL